MKSSSPSFSNAPLYASLEDHRPALIGPKHWLGNLRWFAEEMNTLGSFIFRTCPLDRTEEEFRYVGEPDSQARRTLLGVDLSRLGAIHDCRYRPIRRRLRWDYTG